MLIRADVSERCHGLRGVHMTQRTHRTQKGGSQPWEDVGKVSQANAKAPWSAQAGVPVLRRGLKSKSLMGDRGVMLERCLVLITSMIRNHQRV